MNPTGRAAVARLLACFVVTLTAFVGDSQGHAIDQLPGDVIIVESMSGQLPKRLQGPWLALRGNPGKQRLQAVTVVFWRTGDDIFPYAIHTRPQLRNGTLLFRGLGLSKGPVRVAKLPTDTDLQAANHISVTDPVLGRIRVSYPCAGKNPYNGQPECSLRVEAYGLSQRIEGYSFATKEQGSIRLAFLGDIDRDGRFDLAIDYSSSGEGFCGGTVYFLSSLAHSGSLLHSVEGPQACD